MPKIPTFPTLYDSVLQINISKLKEWSFLEPGRMTSGTLSWSSDGKETATVSVRVNTRAGDYFIELSYKYYEEKRKYKLELVSVPSNFGIGNVWYFVCPQTYKRCRKLYLIDGYFLHREAFTGCMYDCQKRSKLYRYMDDTFGAYIRTDDYYAEIYSKHFKRTYAGKPTKRYLRLMKKIAKAKKVNHNDFNSFFEN